MITRIYRIGCFVSGNGPRVSILMKSSGSDAGKAEIYNYGGKRKNRRVITMENLIGRCALGCVEDGRVLSFKSQLHRSLEFHSKENERFNGSAETPVNTENIKERGSTKFGSSVCSSPLKSATLREPWMEELSFFP